MFTSTVKIPYQVFYNALPFQVKIPENSVVKKLKGKYCLEELLAYFLSTKCQLKTFYLGGLPYINNLIQHYNDAQKCQEEFNKFLMDIANGSFQYKFILDKFKCVPYEERKKILRKVNSLLLDIYYLISGYKPKVSDLSEPLPPGLLNSIAHLQPMFKRYFYQILEKVGLSHLHPNPQDVEYELTALKRWNPYFHFPREVEQYFLEEKQASEKLPPSKNKTYLYSKLIQVMYNKLISGEFSYLDKKYFIRRLEEIRDKLKQDVLRAIAVLKKYKPIIGYILFIKCCPKRLATFKPNNLYGFINKAITSIQKTQQDITKLMEEELPKLIANLHSKKQASFPMLSTLSMKKRAQIPQHLRNITPSTPSLHTSKVHNSNQKTDLSKVLPIAAIAGGLLLLLHNQGG